MSAIKRVLSVTFLLSALAAVAQYTPSTVHPPPVNLAFGHIWPVTNAPASSLGQPGDIAADYIGGVLYQKVGTSWSVVANGSGSGNVVGPNSSTDQNIAVYSGTTGKVIADGGVKTSSFVQANNGTATGLTVTGLHINSPGSTNNGSQTVLGNVQAGTYTIGQWIIFPGSSANSFWLSNTTYGSTYKFTTNGILAITQLTASTVIDSGLTANTVLQAAGTKAVTSVPNGTGFLKNNGGGSLSYTLDGSDMTFLTPSTATATGMLGLDASGHVVSNAVPTGGTGSQTPLLQDVNGAGNSVTNLLNLSGSGTVSFNEFDIGTGIFTNLLTPTNAQAGTTIDFRNSQSTTNCAGNVVISSWADINTTNYNTFILHVLPNGADRTITFPTGTHLGRYMTGVVTNGTTSDFYVFLQSGVVTNVDQSDHL